MAKNSDDSLYGSANVSISGNTGNLELNSLPGSSSLELNFLSGSSSLDYQICNSSIEVCHSCTDSSYVTTNSTSEHSMPSSLNTFSAAQNNPIMYNVSSPKVVWSEKDLEIKDIERPAHLREEQYDVVLIYCEKDVKEAVLFKNIMEKYIILSDNNPSKVCTLDKTEYLQWVRSKFRHLEEAVARSTYMFLYMSENFVNDAWADLQKDECLQESIDNPEKKWCVVPVHTLPKKLCKYGTPWGLKSLKGIFVDTMLKGKRLKDVEFEQIDKSSLDPFFIKSMSKLLDCRLNMKLNRIEAQKREIELWKEQEAERRHEALLQYKQDEEIRKAKRAKERELNEQRRQKLKQQELEDIQNMSHTAGNCTSNAMPPGTASNMVPPAYNHLLFKQLLDSLKMTGMSEEKAIQQAFLCMQMSQNMPQQIDTSSRAPMNIFNITNSAGISIGDRNEQTITSEVGNTKNLQNEEDEGEVIIERTVDRNSPFSQDFEYDNSLATENNLRSFQGAPYATQQSKSSLESTQSIDNDETLEDETNLKDVYTNLSHVNIAEVNSDSGANGTIDSQIMTKNSSNSQSKDFSVHCQHNNETSSIG